MKILFICTHNRCRSILSEAITNHLSDESIEAFSAGSQPVGEVHPLTLKYLEEAQISTEGLYSKSWDEFESDQPNIVVTVCDSAANEACPTWFGDTIKLHWGLSDPSKVEGTEEDIANAFRGTIEIIKDRLTSIQAIDFQNLDKNQLSEKLQELTRAI